MTTEAAGFGSGTIKRMQSINLTFRMVNAGGTQTIEVVLVNQNGSEPTSDCEVWEIAFDGMYLDYARRPALGKSLINSAARVDWIVICNNPGVYEVSEGLYVHIIHMKRIGSKL